MFLRSRRALNRWRRFFLWNCAILLVSSLLIFLYSFGRQWPFPLRIQRARSRPLFEYSFNDNRGKEVSTTELLLPEGSASLQERAKLPNRPSKESLLLMWDLNFSDKNLRGCPDWNCKVTHNHSQLFQACAVFFASAQTSLRQQPGQYFVHYSQESPLNMGANGAPPHFFNMSFGFRMDTPAASPYGFAARLAPWSRSDTQFWKELQEGIASRKGKAVAWFVSHCGTQSGREWIAKELQKHLPVDIYGTCGPLKCPRGADCKAMLDTHYHFYFAAENSICRDYLTEKIWDQGLDSLSVPIVLRRSLVQHLLPPNSFLAVDDFASIGQLAGHLLALMADRRKYLRHFEWRADFVAVKLNGDTDPRAERLFGVCQVCRLTQLEPMPQVRLPAPMSQWWDGSCEKSGRLIQELAGDGKN